MDPPQPPAAAISSSAAASTNIHHLVTYPPADPLDSSPKRPQSHADGITSDGGSGGGGVLPRLRLMCSYGGHIIPRPHDKTLCYVGGETRIIVVDRNSTVASLSARLSRALSLDGRPFTLKYQLPNEDLDSLVSVAFDEDIDIMTEEYDRIAAATLSSPRIRLFVFFNKPATAASMGSFRSESWFLDSLNSSGSESSSSGFLLLPRNLSDTALVTGLVGDQQHAHYGTQGHRDSLILVENFTEAPPPPPSYTTSPSAIGSLLPPILVADTGNQEQFVYHHHHQQQQQLTCVEVQLDNNNISISATPPNSSSSSSSSSTVPPPSITPAGGSNENLNRLSSEDDEETRSDHSRTAPPTSTGFRKPPLPLTHQHSLHKPSVGIGNNFYIPPPSPDSVVSESSSIASMASLAKVISTTGFYEELAGAGAGGLNSSGHQNENNNGKPNNLISTINPVMDQIQTSSSSHIPIHHNQDIVDGYTFMDHQQQQQKIHFVKPGPAGGQLMSSSYYPPPPTPSHHQQHHQQFPAAVYIMPVTMSPHHHQLPLYPTKNGALSSGGKGGEMGVMYGTNGFTSMVPPGHQLYHLHHHPHLQFNPQHHHQFMGYSQMQHQPGPDVADAAATSTGGGGANSNYGYDYGAPLGGVSSPHDHQHQMFYTPQQQQQQQLVLGTNVMPSPSTPTPTPTPTPHHQHHQQYQQATSVGGFLASDHVSNHNGHGQHQNEGGSSKRLQ